MHFEGFTAVERQLLEHQQDEFVDLGLQLELELCRLATPAAPDWPRTRKWLTPSASCSQPSCSFAARCDAVAGTTSAISSAPSLSLNKQCFAVRGLGRLAHEAAHVGGLLQVIEPLQPPLQTAQQFGTGPKRRSSGRCGQCKSSLRHAPATPPAPEAQLLIVSDPGLQPAFVEFQHAPRSKAPPLAASFSATAFSRSAKRSKFSASSKNRSGGVARRHRVAFCRRCHRRARPTK